MSFSLVLTLLTLMPLTSLEGPEAPSGYTLVVSSSAPTTAVKRRDLARIFLKKVTRWEDGSAAVPVDQSAGAVVRSAFTKDVMRTEGLGQLSSVVSYWQQQLFSGAGTPPPIKSDDAEVMAFVAANKGAVGYVSAGTPLVGVRALKIAE